MKRVLLIFGLAAVLSFFGALAIYFLHDAPEQIPAANSAPTQTASPKNEIKIPEETNAKLQAEADALLPLFDKMLPVTVYLKDEIINPKGSTIERGVAYTTCAQRNQPAIYLKKIFYTKANRRQLINILKHELTHSYFCRKGSQQGHDAQFRQKFTEVGGFGN